LIIVLKNFTRCHESLDIYASTENRSTMYSSIVCVQIPGVTAVLFGAECLKNYARNFVNSWDARNGTKDQSTEFI